MRSRLVWKASILLVLGPNTVFNVASLVVDLAPFMRNRDCNTGQKIQLEVEYNGCNR